MYAKILIPVAYEPGYDIGRELQVARALAKPHGAQVVLAHVMEKTPFYAIDYMPQGWREELHDAILADLAQHAATVPGGSVAVLEGEPGRTLLDHAQAEGVDCIILAAHRSEPALIGSTATWIARNATCAVHLIR
ncbi:universal stress protein [Pararhodobacter zhoushanensis]|uniref:Universal stress protein n=1 Tax=Pararhodobacter zhoushanensis TaxID=2479545 RepID=A0ABT3GZ39_9RHOB|nr:universal stress protein [Pararhodobacter zhoushanensis]MCW1932796.1 universal stress protein [Pararhodobacter zhoushanensis]